jgi:hypothetical protein
VDLFDFFLLSVGIVRRRESKVRQCNGQKKKGKQKNNDPQSTTQKAKD